MTEKREIKVFGYEMLEKTPRRAGKSSTSCTVYLPKRWEGKKVVVIRIEE